jgi:hypothetical protein
VEGVASEGVGGVEPVAVACPLEILSAEPVLATLGGAVEVTDDADAAASFAVQNPR